MKANPGNAVAFLKRTLTKKWIWILAGIAVAVWLLNASFLVDRSGKDVELLAHAALGQTYDLDGVKWDTNTAAIIHPPEHHFIENTIPSIRAAFAYGADIVEFDVRLTADKQLAVFHDFTLEHRTDGVGLVSDHTMDELRRLDVGYGYTADGGRTYPLRGRGYGLMVSIGDVFRAFPEGQFLIHIKDGGEESGRVLLEFLRSLDESRIADVSVYGNDEALTLIRERYPEMKILSKRRLVDAGLRYLLIGWTGYVPAAIHNMELHLPVQYAPLMWGWPDRFLERMERVNTRVVLVRYVNGWSDGFDSAEELSQLPAGYTGTVWTNRIDVVGPVLKSLTHN